MAKIMIYGGKNLVSAGGKVCVESAGVTPPPTSLFVFDSVI